MYTMEKLSAKAREILEEFKDFCTKHGGRVVQDEKYPTIFHCILPRPTEVELRCDNKFSKDFRVTLFGEEGTMLLRGLKRVTIGNYTGGHTWVDANLKPWFTASRGVLPSVIDIDAKSSPSKVRKITLNLADGAGEWVVLSLE